MGFTMKHGGYLGKLVTYWRHMNSGDIANSSTISIWDHLGVSEQVETMSFETLGFCRANLQATPLCG
jgi:hypothetical protein